MRSTGFRRIADPPRVVTLSIPDLSMLVRFAILTELHDGTGVPGEAREVTQATLLSYASSMTGDRLERWWPLLRAFAGEWLVQQRAS